MCGFKQSNICNSKANTPLTIKNNKGEKGPRNEQCLLGEQHAFNCSHRVARIRTTLQRSLPQVRRRVQDTRTSDENYVTVLFSFMVRRLKESEDNSIPDKNMS
ncbi:hypothetical protein CEXT_396141 [Caerostris extrusa]|uniref:Uncharacterized protein n=1 Tax=Caerostris extrusa TaxID=172846 RepID=A0AAV4MUA5_CAEEX|nr:hypothetical protein CEXT_396141 [Caerostris extrusa]